MRNANCEPNPSEVTTSHCNCVVLAHVTVITNDFGWDIIWILAPASAASSTPAPVVIATDFTHIMSIYQHIYLSIYSTFISNSNERHVN